MKAVQRIRSLPRPLLLPLVLILVALAVVVCQSTGTKSQTRAAANPTPPGVSARGELQPVAQAKVGTLNGGVVTSLSVAVGAKVRAEQEIARVRGPAGAEVLTAPWAGTITGVLVHDGDSVTPGKVIATVADLTRLQVETTDVDEYIVASVHVGQEVIMIVEALDYGEFHGYVRSVALQPQTNSTGDSHYPVIIDLTETTPDLRAGMSVRVYFQER